MKLTLQEKINRYYNERPLYDTYKGWNIRKRVQEYRLPITKEIFHIDTFYCCDVIPGWKSIESSEYKDVIAWIDEQIKLGLEQKEDI